MSRYIARDIAFKLVFEYVFNKEQDLDLVDSLCEENKIDTEDTANEQKEQNSNNSDTNKQESTTENESSGADKNENTSEITPEQSKDESAESTDDDSNATPASSFDYKIDFNNSKVLIQGFKGSEKNVVIPNSIEGFPVTNISGFVSSTVETLIIPESVNSISPNAITAEKLKTVTVKSKTVNVWGSAFDRCPLLESVTFAGKATIEGITFNKCNNLKEIVFLGDAPATLSANYLISGEYYDIVTIKYMKNANGWDDPKWESFNLVEIK